jgi:carbonic anhydrase/acetyltransferase-like protein (isoleucine patch superfamily)
MPLILEYDGKKPNIHHSAFIAENVVISGDVEVHANASIWYNCVIRGDVAKVVIGENSNIQDGTIIHGTRPFQVLNKTGADGGIVTIGKNVTVGHSCIIHGCTIEDNTFVGMGSIVMDLSIIQAGGMLGAGSLLTTKSVLNSNTVWSGRPAKMMRALKEDEKAYILQSAINYFELSRNYIQIEQKHFNK